MIANDMRTAARNTRARWQWFGGHRVRGAVGGVSLACYVLAGGACSSTATFQRSGGLSLEGEIVHGDSTAVYAKGGNGLIYRVERSSLYDIDHPGNVHMLVGAVCLAMSVAGLVSGQFASSEYERRDGRAIGAAYGAVGLPLLGYGSYFYLRSKRAEAGRGQMPFNVQVLPRDLPVLPPPSGVPQDSWAPPPERR